MDSHGLWSTTAPDELACLAPPDENLSTDVAIIGGGFTGLSAALHLAERGVRVLVLESEQIGHGASGRNGGQVTPGLRLGRDPLVSRFGESGERLYRMAQEAPDFLENLVGRHDLECGFERRGVLRMAHSEKALSETRAVYEQYRTMGVDGLRMIDRDDLERESGTRRYLGALHDPRGGCVHPLALAQALGVAGVRHGARIFEHTPARVLERTGTSWRIRHDRGEVKADRVILATNAYSGELLPGLSRSVLPVSSFQIATERLDGHILDTVLPGGQTAHDTRRLILYFRKSPDGRVMLGGRASFSSSSDSMQGDEDFRILRSVLVDMFPQLEHCEIAYRWGGLVCITPDQIPHYHEPAPGLHVMLGYCGRGVALANRVGAWLANRLLGASDEGDIPLTALRPMPLHGLREPVLNLVMRYHRMMDRLGR